MINDKDNTSPSANPPPDPPSVPLLGTELRRAGQLIGRGEYQAGINRARSTWANFWTFRVRARSIGAHCPCCGWQGPGFVSLSNWRAVQHHSLCPRCGSRSRHRGLALLLPGLLRGAVAGPILVFAPETALIDHITRDARAAVETTDFLRTDVDFPGEDIQKLSFPDERYAILICNHVLEHIPDDRAALRECARVLKPGGVAIFTIPGDYDKAATRYFNQPDSNGHLRHYGLDVMDKMREAFASAEAVDLSLGTDPRQHIHPGDLAFICRK